MFNKYLKLNNQGNIALILVIMVTTLTLVSALTLALVNISDLTANYHLIENEQMISQRDSCLEDALSKVSQNLYATGTYYLVTDNIYCDYQISETIDGFKTVTTTAAALADFGYWQGTVIAEVNVSSTPIALNSYKDLSGDAWSSADWLYRMKISIHGDQVSEDLHNFPVYLDLADLGSSFFSHVNSDGSDIVITTADGSTKLLREVVRLSTGGESGELHFLAPILASGVDTDFYIYFGNAAATEANNLFWLADYSLVQHLDQNPSDVAPQMLDSSQSQNDGSSYGSMLSGDLVDAKIGKGIDFDGSDDGISLGTFNNLTSAQGTISFWVKFNTIQVSTPFHFYESAYTDFIRAYLYADGRILLTVEDGDAQMISAVNNTFNPDTTTWRYLAWTQDGVAAKLYIDGEEAVLTGTNSGDWWTDHLTLSGATIGDGSWGNAAAIMDEFRVSNKALSAEWIATEYNNQNDTTTFYSTTTAEYLPGGTPCDGYSYEGYCWYYASTFNMSCDQVCAENALSCVSGVGYGPDTNCDLNKGVSGKTCLNGCYAADGQSYAPGVYDAYDFCLFDNLSPAYICSETESAGIYNIICACE
ncbi:LamG domain-containing protein [Candidatus Nomurabacteria bacterium]|nr:LamG domain-containing protein [Candidatus Nomurabacteria bacterium]